jgi:hypothetical protein
VPKRRSVRYTSYIVMKISLYAILLSAVASCQSKEFLCGDRGEICYAIERNESYQKGVLYLDTENDMLFEFPYGIDSVLTTANLIGCSEDVTKSIHRFYDDNKNYSDNGKIKIGVWGVVMSGPENRKPDVIAEMMVAL